MEKEYQELELCSCETCRLRRIAWTESDVETTYYNNRLAEIKKAEIKNKDKAK